MLKILGVTLVVPDFRWASWDKNTFWRYGSYGPVWFLMAEWRRDCKIN